MREDQNLNEAILRNLGSSKNLVEQHASKKYKLRALELSQPSEFQTDSIRLHFPLNTPKSQCFHGYDLLWSPKSGDVPALTLVGGER